MTFSLLLLCRELKWKIGNGLSGETVEMEMGGRLMSIWKCANNGVFIDNHIGFIPESMRGSTSRESMKEVKLKMILKWKFEITLWVKSENKVGSKRSCLD